MNLKERIQAFYGDQTPEEIELAQHVRSKVEECRSSASRIASEGIWMTNIAYLLGYDGVAFDTVTRQFKPVNRASGYLKKSRIHVNKILPTIQNRLARLCKNPPKYDVMPESNSTSDKEAARLGVQILGALWEKLSLNEKRLWLTMWVQQCGHAYMKVSWDTEAGQFLRNPLDGNFEYEGDVRNDVVSAFEIFPNPVAKSWDDVKRSWLVHAKVRPLDYFRSHYGAKGKLVKEEDAWLLSVQYEQRINSMNSRGSSESNTLKNSAIELCKYEARSKKHPNGRMIVVANGILLEDKELPVGEIPFAKFDDVIVGGKYYSEAIITHLRPVQDQYNQTIRRRARWVNKLVAGKYASPRGSGLMSEALNDDSGEVVYFDPVPGTPEGGKPTPIQVPNIPAFAYQEDERLDGIFNDISGIGEVSRGTLPSASIPAIGMQLLTEQDDTRIGVMIEQHERAWAEVGSLDLKYVEKFYVTPRKLKMAGENLQYTVKEVTGSQIAGNTDVIVKRGSTLPGSKVLNRQEILNTYDRGLLGDPADPKVREKVLGMIEFGDVTEMWEDYGLDMAQIRRGIQSLENGIDVEVNELDNNALWVQELNRYRKGDKFGSLDPLNQQIILDQIEKRVQALMEINNATPPPPEMTIPGGDIGVNPETGLPPMVEEELPMSLAGGI